VEMIVGEESEYIEARKVLLDALDALGVHRRSVILVGAQAIYLQVGRGDLAVAPMTTDADLALRVDWVADEPELYGLMNAAGFVAGAQPGTWLGHGDVSVDLLVAPHQGGRSGRAARAAMLDRHRKGVARIARGLEPALIDHTPRDVRSLEGRDGRSHQIFVAGPSALLVAKLIKLQERMASSDTSKRDRVRAKDALDAFRLLREVDMDVLVAGFHSHRHDKHAADVSGEAIVILQNHGLRDNGRLPRLVSEALGDDHVAAASFVVLARALVDALQ
jgi:hypothetical protein